MLRANKALFQGAESYEHFAVRRVQYVAKQHRNCVQVMTVGYLVDQLNLWRFRNSPLVQQALQQAIATMSGDSTL